MNSVSSFRIAIGRLFAAIALCGAFASARAATLEELFKWGEFDSLVKVLEPEVAKAAAGSARDSSGLSQKYLYLGVAYYAQGKHDQADDAFSRACELDSVAHLDRFYVSEEIAGHFEGLEAAIRRRREAARRNAAAGPGAGTGSGGNTGVTEVSRSDGEPSGKRARVSSHAKALWWVAAGGAAAVAAAAGAYFMLRPASSDHVTVIDAR